MTLILVKFLTKLYFTLVKLKNPSSFYSNVILSKFYICPSFKKIVVSREKGKKKEEKKYHFYHLIKY
jgi:hypothetical protein